MYLKVLGLLAALSLLAACETPAEDTGSTEGSGEKTATTTGGSSTPAAPAATTVPGSQQDFVVNVGDRVFFPTNKSDLNSESTATLKKQAAWLRKYNGVTLVIEGHCDERGTTEFNIGLGVRRANSVKDYLISFGVPSNRIKTVSYGKSRPTVPGSNEWAWSQNRRSVTVIKGGAAS
jgi:peptidoglycan-associated lipoprotein